MINVPNIHRHDDNNVNVQPWDRLCNISIINVDGLSVYRWVGNYNQKKKNIGGYQTGNE